MKPTGNRFIKYLFRFWYDIYFSLFSKSYHNFIVIDIIHDKLFKLIMAQRIYYFIFHKQKLVYFQTDPRFVSEYSGILKFWKIINKLCLFVCKFDYNKRDYSWFMYLYYNIYLKWYPKMPKLNWKKNEFLFWTLCIWLSTSLVDIHQIAMTKDSSRIHCWDIKVDLSKINVGIQKMNFDVILFKSIEKI